MDKEKQNYKDLDKAQGIHSPLRSRLLTIKEAATYLGRGVDSMRELVYGRAFKVVQASDHSKVWIDVRDLDAWIDANKHYMGQPVNEQ